jgi:hypothetical protein
VIPRQYAASCIHCGLEVDVRKPGVCQRAQGWLMNREQGGANAVIMVERAPVYSCKTCIELKRKGISPAQGVLWNASD